MAEIMEALVKGALAPLRAIVNPRQLFTYVGRSARKYGVYFTAMFYLGAWLASSMAASFIIFFATMVRSIINLDIIGFMLSPITTISYSFLFPLIAAGFDSLLIIIPVYFAEERPPLHTVLAVRSSSLLPYTLRVVLLAITGHLTLRALVSASTTLYSLALLLAGTALTYYGLVKTGVPRKNSAIGALLPLLYKLLL